MTNSLKAAALFNAIVPRAGKVPSDIDTLLSTDPMTATLAHMGGSARVDRAHANAIQALIDDARGVSPGTRHIAGMIARTLAAK